MQGLAAISANNGWAMALTGACIVLLGLSTLSFIISQLHRLIGLFEKEDTPKKTNTEADTTSAAVDLSGVEVNLLKDVAATAKLYQPLTGELGEIFGLSQLYHLMEAKNLPHPHITVRELRDAGYLVPTGKGTFSWKSN